MKQLLIGVIFFVIGAGAWNWLQTSGTLDKVMAKAEGAADTNDYSVDYNAGAEDVFESIEQNAQKNHPGELKSVGMQKESTKMMDTMIKDAETPGEKRLMVSSAFFGAYLLNTYERPRFCKLQGVDLSPFVNAFKAEHVKEHAEAKKVLTSEGINEEMLIKEAGDQLKQMTEIDMKDIATVVGGDLAKACQFMNDKAAMMVSEMTFRKRSPEAHAILMGQ